MTYSFYLDCIFITQLNIVSRRNLQYLNLNLGCLKTEVRDQHGGMEADKTPE
jgi:hypothetical protein